MKQFFLLFFMFLLSFTLILNGQESINSGGGSASGSGGSIAYSVGQIAYTTSTGTNGSVSAGVQQAYDITIINGLNVSEITLGISTYPNPTTDFVFLKVDTETLVGYSYQVFDLSGKLLNDDAISNTETQISLNSNSGIYFIKVFSNKQEIKTFKVIKN